MKCGFINITFHIAREHLIAAGNSLGHGLSGNGTFGTAFKVTRQA
jgi:hypothetical protein